MWSSVASGQYTSCSIASSNRSRPRQYRKTQCLIASRSASCAAMATTEYLVTSTPFLRRDDSHDCIEPLHEENSSRHRPHLPNSGAAFGFESPPFIVGSLRSSPPKRSATAANSGEVTTSLAAF